SSAPRTIPRHRNGKVSPRTCRFLSLLDFSLGTNLFELRRGGVGFLPGDALSDRRRHRIDDILGLPATQARQLPTRLAHLDFLGPDIRQLTVELSLLFFFARTRAAGSCTRRTGGGNRRGGGHAPLVLKRF